MLDKNLKIKSEYKRKSDNLIKIFFIPQIKNRVYVQSSLSQAFKEWVEKNYNIPVTEERIFRRANLLELVDISDLNINGYSVNISPLVENTDKIFYLVIQKEAFDTGIICDFYVGIKISTQFKNAHILGYISKNEVKCALSALKRSNLKLKEENYYVIPHNFLKPIDNFVEELKLLEEIKTLEDLEDWEEIEQDLITLKKPYYNELHELKEEEFQILINNYIRNKLTYEQKCKLFLHLTDCSDCLDKFISIRNAEYLLNESFKLHKNEIMQATAKDDSFIKNIVDTTKSLVNEVIIHFNYKDSLVAYAETDIDRELDLQTRFPHEDKIFTLSMDEINNKIIIKVEPPVKGIKFSINDEADYWTSSTITDKNGEASFPDFTIDDFKKIIKRMNNALKIRIEKSE